ncbi:hypothetical protein KEM52_000556 [Ascosphaera acerosa]|nr:hypothetical protein KEM52_000556 [Ascosphaera acerosa]
MVPEQCHLHRRSYWVANLTRAAAAFRASALRQSTASPSTPTTPASPITTEPRRRPADTPTPPRGELMSSGGSSSHAPRTPANRVGLLAQGTQLMSPRPPYFDVPGTTEVQFTVDGQPGGVQRLDTSKRMARTIMREDWRSTVPPGKVDYRGHERKVSSQNCVNAIMAHLNARTKPKGWGCARCENNGNPFTSCRVSTVWAPNGACTGCLHGGKGPSCSFVRRRREVLRARSERDLLDDLRERRADEIAKLASHFSGRVGPRAPYEDMSAEEAREIAEEGEKWARYVRLLSEMQQDVSLLSPGVDTSN